jgi:hypothetical protein
MAGFGGDQRGVKALYFCCETGIALRQGLLKIGISKKNADFKKLISIGTEDLR